MAEFQRRETIVYTYHLCGADYLVKSGSGVLHTVTINRCAVVGTLTLYDNTSESGSAIANINLLANMVPVTLIYDLEFKNGLYVGFDATLAADVTVSYR